MELTTRARSYRCSKSNRHGNPKVELFRLGMKSSKNKKPPVDTDEIITTILPVINSNN
jgi:hypothetical protein